MGFMDKLKSFATASKCKIGAHAGEWSQISDKPECQLEKTCPNCNKYLTKSNHEYGDWQFEDESSCDATRECTHCGEQDYDTIHQYETVGQNEDGVDIEICCKCGDEK